MEKLLLEGSENTPHVMLDPKTGTFEMAGRSLPAEAREVYEPILRWIDKYADHPNPVTEFVFKLEYINTGSSKMLLDLFFALQKINGARVSWYFFEDDEDMEETGEEFAELVKLPFELKAY
jgi:hypothetical protein